MDKTAIIVPCYNEYERLDVAEFTRFLKENGEITFIFVDDGSTDNTLERLGSMHDSVPERALYIGLQGNHGKAEAVRQGFLAAKDGGFKNIGYWDADLSTPLSTIKSMLEKLRNDDIAMVLGSRVRLLGRDIRRPLMRHYGGRIFATVASMVLKLPVYDTQCGAKIFRNDAEMRRVFSRPFKVNWTFDVELLGRLKILREIGGASPLSRSSVEYPLEQWRDIGGSKVKALDFFRAFCDLFKIYLFQNLPVIRKKYIAELSG